VPAQETEEGANTSGRNMEFKSDYIKADTALADHVSIEQRVVTEAISPPQSPDRFKSTVKILRENPTINIATKKECGASAMTEFPGTPHTHTEMPSQIDPRSEFAISYNHHPTTIA